MQEGKSEWVILEARSPHRTAGRTSYSRYKERDPTKNTSPRCTFGDLKWKPSCVSPYSVQYFCLVRKSVFAFSRKYSDLRIAQNIVFHKKCVLNFSPFAPTNCSLGFHFWNSEKNEYNMWRFHQDLSLLLWCLWKFSTEKWYV